MPHVVAPRTWRTVATWRPLSDGRVRVIVTTWGARDVVAQHAWTVRSLRHAWPLLAQVGAVPPRWAGDPHAFLAWALVARRWSRGRCGRGDASEAPLLRPGATVRTPGTGARSGRSRGAGA